MSRQNLIYNFTSVSTRLETIFNDCCRLVNHFNDQSLSPMNEILEPESTGRHQVYATEIKNCFLNVLYSRIHDMTAQQREIFSVRSAIGHMNHRI